MAQDSKYWPAEDVKACAQEDLIPTHHAHLAEANIAYLFVEELPKTHGKTCLAKVKKAGPLERYLGEVDYVMVVNYETWTRLTDAQCRAVIDHELCHCTMRPDEHGRPRYGLQGHDLEEFTEIVARHGLWRPDVEEFAEAVQQQLPFQEAS